MLPAQIVEEKLKEKKRKKMDHNEQLGIRSITEVNKKQAGERLKEYITFNWMFNRWYEKVILVVLFYMGLWKIWGLIFK